MDATASSFSTRSNAKRAAEQMIAKGTAPTVDYGIKPSNGRFEVVWKTALTAPEFAETAEAQTNQASKAEGEDWPNTAATTEEVETKIATVTASADEPAASGEPAPAEPAPVTTQPKPENKWPNGTRVMVRKRKSWREATIVSRLEPDYWRAEYPGGGSGMFQRADIRAYDAERDAKLGKQPRRVKATTPRKASLSSYAIDPEAIAAGTLPNKPPVVRQRQTRITRSISTGCSALPGLATGTRCATTRSKGATAIPKWSRATARICWSCTPLRGPPNERARSTSPLPRLARRAAPQGRDAPPLALPLHQAGGASVDRAGRARAGPAAVTSRPLGAMSSKFRPSPSSTARQPVNS